MIGASIDRRVVADLVGAAVLAPSSHNTQPWRFGVSADAIHVRLDRSRVLAVTDPDGREALISCGAALFNIRVAAAAAGLGIATDLLPGGPDGDFLASVRLTGDAVEPGLDQLHGRLTHRHTYRAVLEPRGFAPDLARSLESAADAEHACLVELASQADREALAELVAEGDRRQFDDPRWRRELATWIRPGGSDDGLHVGASPAWMTRLAVSNFDMGESTAMRDTAMISEAPYLAVITTSGDSPWHWLVAGQALQRILLLAAAGDHQAAFFNQPCQVPELRPRLAALAGRGVPQVAFRLGVPARQEHASRRRPLDAVVDIV